MDDQNRSALKEWAAMEQILAAGSACVLLRKGGIWEKKDGFEMEHREFWIFPTHFHQNPHELAPEFKWALDPASQPPDAPDRIRIEHYAVVRDAFRVDDLETLLRLDGQHALDAATVESRFRYRGRPYLYVLVLRMYRMPTPHLVPNTLDYEGCVSWVTLDVPLSTNSALPVLSDSEFDSRRSEVIRRLGSGESVQRV
ncbi:MAG: DUF1802 family protein [Gemmatimonadetes bacterium]|nr:DUF1802 family protein [Gemmatimonadota bacterium]